MSHHLGSSGSRNSVAERRLRPIYDWLNSGNNKRALQESDRILKKSAGFSCCKVLKSLALLRMGREDEAQGFLDSVLAEGPTDEETLQAMAIAYKESLQLEKICQMYEVATEKEPNNEDLLSHLFMSYVRIGDYKKQQSAAFALYKAAPKNPYYFWAIMSIILRADQSPSNAQFAFPLASRMMAKMEKENKMKQLQETHLYLMVMEAQDKYEEALEILEGPLGKRLAEETSLLNFVAFKRIELLKKLGRWKEVYNHCKESIVENPDQWNLYLDIVHSAYQLSSDDCTSSIELEDCSSFLKEQSVSNPSCRGPHLAQIEFLHRGSASREGHADDRILDRLLNYIKLFGHKAMCFSDINPYFDGLEGESLKGVLEDARSSLIQLDENGFPKTVDDVSRHLFLFQIRRFTGEFQDLDVDDSMKIIEELLKTFSSVQHLVSGYEGTELKPTDMYIVLVSHFLWDLWNKTSQDRFFMLATRILSASLDLSPSNFHLRFLLIKFYNLAGAVGCSLNVHEGLGLKHIQLDSLGYVVSRHALTCGHFEEASGIYSSTLKFFTRNHKDTVDHIISAYRCGSFDKIREFIKLRDRLSNSIHGATLQIESSLLEALRSYTPVEEISNRPYLNGDVDDDDDNIPWEDLHDNRDFRVMVSFDPINRSVSESLIRENFELEKFYLKARSLIIRSLTAACFLSEDIHSAVNNNHSLTDSKSSPHLNKNGANEDKENVKTGGTSHLDILESCCHELKSLQPPFDDPSSTILQGPDPSRASAYLPYAKFHGTCLELVIAVHKQAEEQEKISAAESVAKEYDDLLSLLKKREDGTIQLHRAGKELQDITFALDATNNVSILVNSLVAKFKSSKSKKNKKKKGTPNEQEKFVCAFDTLQRNIYYRLSTFGDDVSRYQSALIRNLDSLPAEESFLERVLEPLKDSLAKYSPSHLKSSYVVSFYQILEAHKVKSNYFVCRGGFIPRV